MADLIEREPLLEKMFPCFEKKLVREAPAVNRWIPVEDDLPEQEVRILLFASGEVYVGELTDIKDLYDTDIGFMKSGHVTHWMPLPEPPKEDET